MVSAVTLGALMVKLKLVGAEKYQSDLEKVEERTTRSSSRITAFLKKWRLAYASIAATAASVFYAIARVSPSVETQMTRLRIAYENLFMTIGEKLAPVFEPLIAKHEEMIYRLADWIDQLNIGLLPALEKAAQKAHEYGEKIREVSGWQALFARPFGDLQTSLAGLAFGYEAILRRLMEITAEKLRPLIDKLSEAWNRIKEKAWEKWSEIKAIPGNMLEKAVAKVTGWVSRLKTSLEKWWERIRTGASRAWNKIKDAIVGPIREAYHQVAYYIGRILDKLENVPGIGGMISMATTPARAGAAGTTVNASNIFNVQAAISSDHDLEQLARKLAELFNEELYRRSGS